MTDNSQIYSERPSAWKILCKTASTLLFALRRTVDVAVLALLAYMSCAIMAQVIGRYFFNFSIAWSEETATFAQIWLTVLGAGVAMRYQKHVAVDFLILKAPHVVQRLFSAAALVLGVWFLGVVVVGSLSLVSIGMMVKSPALQLPMAIPYLSLPIGFGYFLLEFAVVTWPKVVGPLGQDTTPNEDLAEL